MSDYLPSTLACRLPEELMTDILARLPVKTLVKFQLVSTSWRSLTKNPYFIQMHLNRQDQNSNSDCFIMEYHKVRNIPKTVYTCSSDGTNVCKPIWNPEFGLEHGMGCCNGILCTTLEKDIYLFGQLFLLFNPAIRDFKYVFKERLEHPFVNATKTKSMSLGFGFDSRANDYKIVRINQYKVEQSNDNLHETHMQTLCEVYSTNSDSWRSFEAVIDGLLVENTSNSNVSGAIHWLAERGNQYFIASFDLSNEVLGEIMLPEIGESFYRQQIIVWKDCLGAVYYYRDQEHVFEIWSMRKYGVRDSWVKVTTFGCHKECLTFLLSRSNGEFLFIEDNDKIFSCNPDDQERKKIEIPGGVPNNGNVFNYKESLAIVDGSSRSELRSKFLQMLLVVLVELMKTLIWLSLGRIRCRKWPEIFFCFLGVIFLALIFYGTYLYYI